MNSSREAFLSCRIKKIPFSWYDSDKKRMNYLWPVRVPIGDGKRKIDMKLHDHETSL